MLHMSKTREKMKKVRDAQRAAGLCTRCGKPKEDPLYTRCETCLAVARRDTKRRHDARKAAGICITCGKPAVPNRIKCEPCLAKARAASAERYKARS